MTAATKTKTPKSPWGNPETASYRKTFIREISFEGATAEVHRELLDVAVEVLHMAHEQGVLKAGPILSYDPDADGGPTAFGAALQIEGVVGADAWGYSEDANYGLVFAGSVEDAQRLSAMAQELLAARGAHEDIIPESEEAWAYVKPGQRELAIGNKGDDVQFIQVLLNASDHGGTYDERTSTAVRWLQQQRGLPETGVVDAATWRLCYPRVTAFSLGRNDAGFTVRVAQALLVAYGWEPELEVTGRYGSETDKAIRRLQEQRGLRVNGYMRGAEWVALLGPREDWPLS